MRRIALLTCLLAAWLPAQKYTGPRPPKPDVPFLQHADTLVPTEAGAAKEEKIKDDIKYVVAGAASAAKTPLSSPIFLFVSEKGTPEQLRLYKFEVKNGQREIMFSRKKKGPLPIRITATRLTSDGLFKIEVDDSLAPGEYSLSPDGTNLVFCFSVI